MPAVDQAPLHGAIVDPSELAAVPGSMLDAAKAYAADVLSLPAEPPRTLPVTPAERACATVLRAYLGYEPEERDRAEEGGLRGMLDRVEQGAREAGLIEMWTTDATPAGAALLARVEAAERTPAAPPGICQGQMHAYRCALPVGHTGLHADEGRFTLWPDAADTRFVVDAADAKGLT